jgi:MFS family permease
MAQRREDSRPALRLIAAAGFAGVVLLALSRDARADNVSPTGKGVAGGALLGAEAVTIVESVAGVRAGWAYAVGALAGAGGGGVGGYFIEKSNASADGKAPVLMLAGGLALIIPAAVLTLNATRYMPEEGATEDRVPISPAAEPGSPGGSVTGAPPPPSPPSTPPPPPPPAGPPQSLLDLHRGSLGFGLPIPDVRPVFTLAEQRQYGMRAETEVDVPLFHVAF